MKAKVCMVSIKVTDMKETKKFYCEKMNFNLEKEYGENIIELNVNGFPIILEKASKPNTLDYGENSQVVLGLQTDDLNKDLEHLKKKRCESFVQRTAKMSAGSLYCHCRSVR